MEKTAVVFLLLSAFSNRDEFSGFIALMKKEWKDLLTQLINTGIQRLAKAAMLLFHYISFVLFLFL